jgi:signal transduction histidine kinase
MADRTPYLYRPLTEHPGASVPTLSHRELLARRLVVNSRIRFVVAVFLVLGPVGAVVLDLLDPTRALILGVMGVLLLFYNSAFYAHARRHESPEASEAAFPQLRVMMLTAVLVDYLVLAVIVALFGGVRSPLTAFYLLHVVLSCLMLARRMAITFTAVAFLLIAVQALAGLTGWAPQTALRSGEHMHALDGPNAAMILGVYAALFAVTDALLISLVEWLRRSEKELRDKNRRLDQLSRLRRDFLHIAVHNLRSPVGAAQMLVENLMAGLRGPLDDRQSEWVLRIGQRLEGLQEMLQDLRLLGDLETEDVEARAEALDLEDILHDVAAEYGYQAESVGLSLVVEAEGKVPRVRGIRRLVREGIVNYVTNAIKYAAETGPVVMAVRPAALDGGAGARVEVRDLGPGIAEEHVARLFEEFFAPPRPGSDTQAPRRSGIGLSIVLRIAEAHGGEVGVETEVGRGSIFWMELPGV